MIRTKKDVQNYINEWQKENRARITLLATLAESEQIKEQAKKEGLSITRYLIKCHNEYIGQKDKNATKSDENKSKGITYQIREK